MEFLSALGIVFIYVVLCYLFYKVLDYIYRYPYVSDRKKKSVLISGCDSGFGFLAAQRFDSYGMQVFAGCLTEKGKKDVESVCTKNTKPFLLDITNTESVQKAVKFVESEIPDDQGLWGLINNAGIQGKVGPEDWFTTRDYQETLEVNLYGCINMSMALLPQLKKSRGRIINTSSVAGRLSTPFLSVYCVSKWALECYSDGLRRFLKPYNVRVSIIEPGGYNTKILDSIEPNMKQAWTDCPDHVKESYEDQAYLEFKNHIMTLVNEVKLKSKPSEVIDSYEHAVLARHPRARYAVGLQARVFATTFASCPEWLQDWIFGKLHYSFKHTSNSKLTDKKLN